MDEYKNNGGLSPLSAGLLGAALGAAAVFFSNKENRDKTERAFSEAGDWVKHTFEDLVGIGREKAARELERTGRKAK